MNLALGLPVTFPDSYVLNTCGIWKFKKWEFTEQAQKNLCLIKVSTVENLVPQEKYFNWFNLFTGIYSSSSSMNIITLWMRMEKMLSFT